MLTFFIDPVAGLAVWIFSGPKSESEVDVCVESFATVNRMAKPGRQTLGMMIVDDGKLPANAAERKRLADAMRKVRCRPMLALIVRSPLVRGALTAIHWLAPPSYDGHFVRNEAEGITLLNEQRPCGVKLLAMVAKARAVASSAETSTMTVL